MIFGSKSAQAMFQTAFEVLKSEYKECSDEKYKWEKFKKQFEHGQCDNYYATSDLRFYRFVEGKWDDWVRCLQEKEMARLEKANSYQGKKYLCRCCGERKAEEQFWLFDKKPVHGDFDAWAYVRVGTGECKQCVTERLREQERKYKRDWYQAHKEEIAARQKANRAARNESNRKYAHANRDKINQYVANKRATDQIYKLKCQTRKIVYQSFARKGGIKPERSEQVIGLPIDDFVSYLKGTYKEVYGKEWNGVEKVHIDHIIPLATATTEEDVLRLCHYTNLRLITEEDNLRKGAKLDYAI